MAFKRRFGGFRRRSFGAKNSRQVPRWTAQTSETTVTAATPVTNLPIYVPGTTIGAGVYEEEELLVRLVGRLGLAPSGANNGGGGVGIGILKTTNTTTIVGGFQDPFQATELAARDWLGVYNHIWPLNATATGFSRDIPIDIKVKRRLKGEEAIRLSVVNGTGGDIVVTIDIRILIVIRL